MRKAGKKRIEQALKDYIPWREKVDTRLKNVKCPQGRINIREWANDVKQRITDGDLSLFTTELCRSVIRAIECFETNFYEKGLKGGGFQLTPFKYEEKQDGEVLGLDNDGAIICYNAENDTSYNSGETPEQFGLQNLTPVEQSRIERTNQ